MSTTVTYKGQTITTAENQTKKLLTAGKYMEDDVTIKDVTSGGAVNLVMGAIRPDAELVQSWTADELAVTDLGLTIPPYSTSNQVLVSPGNFPGTIPIDLNNYDYFEVFRGLTIPIYDNNDIVPGLAEFQAFSAMSELISYPAGTFVSRDGVTIYNQRFSSLSTNNTYVLLYWNTNLTFTPVSSNYGPRIYVSTSGVSGNSMQMPKPGYSIQGNGTFFKQSVWEKLTDIRFQYVAQLYRAPKNNLNYDGWAMFQEQTHISDCIKNNNWTLT